MTQKERIINYLKSGKCITPLEALDMFNCFRLASAIHELKKDGHKIITRMVGNNQKQWAQYYLEGAYKHQPKYVHQMPGYVDDPEQFDESARQ